MAFITVVHNAAERLLQLNSISEGSVKDFVDPKGYLSNKCVDFIEEIKENAFRSVFLEPAMMYFDAVRDHTASGDVDVHGSNLYLAVLQVLILAIYYIIRGKVYVILYAIGDNWNYHSENASMGRRLQRLR